MVWLHGYMFTFVCSESMYIGMYIGMVHVHILSMMKTRLFNTKDESKEFRNKRSKRIIHFKGQIFTRHNMNLLVTTIAFIGWMKYVVLKLTIVLVVVLRRI